MYSSVEYISATQCTLKGCCCGEAWRGVSSRKVCRKELARLHAGTHLHRSAKLSRNRAHPRSCIVRTHTPRHHLGSIANISIAALQHILQYLGRDWLLSRPCDSNDHGHRPEQVSMHQHAVLQHVAVRSNAQALRRRHRSVGMHSKGHRPRHNLQPPHLAAQLQNFFLDQRGYNMV